MKTESSPLVAEPAAASRLVLNPFLHVTAGRIYDPLTDRALAPGEPGHAEVEALVSGAAPDELAPAARAALAAGGWLLSGE
jgi:hypothetical protein